MLPNPKIFLPAVFVFTLLFYLITIPACQSKTLTASWYSIESCKKEGTSGIMANGKRLDDERYTAASWDYPFGTIVKVTNLENQRSVLVEISDRGPAKRLYKEGRVIDLSKGAFRQIADLRTGIINVQIAKVK